ncbi:MAG: alanine racemase [Alphaproteobacteria bacterium]
MHHNTATLRVDLSALAANYTLLRSKLDKRLCAAVVKANAYGLGVGAVSTRLWDEGCRQFFVATLEEAIELRAVLPEAKQIYIFQGVLPGEEQDILHHRLIPVLNSMEQVERWKHDGTHSAALHVDTGMTRLGLTETEALKLAADKDTVQRCGIKLIMSHLACANDGDMQKSADQLARFEKAFRKFPQPMAACLANSAGIFLGAEYHYDMVRPGCALYGINPIHDKNPMQHVATLSAPILQIRTLDRNETVGYGATYEAKKGSRIAIVTLGYADGFKRNLSNKGYGFISGHKAPLVGRVSMDMIALDVSALPAIPEHSRAELINEKQDVNVLAERAGTIGYEIFTGIGNRVKRVYSS